MNSAFVFGAFNAKGHSVHLYAKYPIAYVSFYDLRDGNDQVLPQTEYERHIRDRRKRSTHSS